MSTKIKKLEKELEYANRVILNLLTDLDGLDVIKLPKGAALRIGNRASKLSLIFVCKELVEYLDAHGLIVNHFGNDYLTRKALEVIGEGQYVGGDEL